MIKVLVKLGIEGMYLNIVEVICSKPIFNVILNGEKLKPFSLKSGTRQRCSLSPFCSMYPGISSQGNKTGRRKKRNLNRKGRSKTIPICR
jgi:hypothetical protein